LVYMTLIYYYLKIVIKNVVLIKNYKIIV